MNSSRRVFETFQKGMAYDYELWLKKNTFSLNRRKYRTIGRFTTTEMAIIWMGMKKWILLLKSLTFVISDYWLLLTSSVTLAK